MKKIVMVSGSSRNGNTLGITNIYADEFRKSKCEVSVIDLSKEKIDCCDGCLSCDETQVCTKQDSMENNIALIRHADLLVIGTPARWSLLSGVLKCFIDRLNPYASVEGYNGINAFIFAVGQSEVSSSESIDKAISSVLSFAEDAGLNVKATQKFCELLGEKDYIEHIDDIRLKCEKDVEAVLKEV